MKTKPSLRSTILSFALLSFALNAQAQNATPVAGAPTYGLIGQEYTGVSFGYTHQDDGPPDALRGIGVIFNRPAAVNLDTAFKYDFTRSSAFGMHNNEHRVAANALYYWSNIGAKPFVEADAGWVFRKFAGDSGSGFVYLIGAGVEIQVKPRLAVTPFVNYQDVSEFKDRKWSYGAKVTYRLAQEWSASGRLQVDEDQNVEYRLGMNRHF